MKSAGTTRKAMEVGLGKRPADVVFRGGRLVDVHLARIRENVALGLAGEMIAYLGPEEGNLYGPETVIRDLGGAYLIPGLIDGHTHLDSIFTAQAFAEKGGPVRKHDLHQRDGHDRGRPGAQGG